MDETNKDISDEENEEYELGFYACIIKALIEIYQNDSKEMSS